MGGNANLFSDSVVNKCDRLYEILNRENYDAESFSDFQLILEDQVSLTRYQIDLMLYSSARCGREDAMRLLINSYKADVNFINVEEQNRSVLGAAIAGRHIDCVGLLLTFDPNVDCVADNASALEYVDFRLMLINKDIEADSKLCRVSDRNYNKEKGTLETIRNLIESHVRASELADSGSYCSSGSYFSGSCSC